MKITLHSVWVVSLLLVLSGCATTTIEGDGQLTPSSTHGTHTVIGSFYGFKWSEPSADKCENGRGLYRVREHTDALYVLASVLSLGLYVPQTLEWWCDGSRHDSPNEKIYHPTS